MLEYKVDKVLLKDNRQIRYLCFGNGKKTMVILPGLSISYVTDTAQAVVQAFEKEIDGYTVYLFDVPDKLPNDYHISSLAKDIKEAIDILNLKDIYLYGVSMGGMEALYLAGEYSHLIKKIVICSTTYKVNEESKKLIDKWYLLAKENNGQELYKVMANAIYSSNTLKAYGDVLTSGYETLTNESYQRFITLLNLVKNVDLTEQVKKIDVPMLVLGSRGDHVFSDKEIESITKLVKCDCYMYGNDYGHGVYDEALDIKGKIFKFFNKE